MAELGGPGSWLTLISGVAAGEPSGGGDGLLFPSAAALSLQRRDKRRGRMEGGPSVQEGVPLTGKAPHVEMCVHVCEHVSTWANVWPIPH